MHDSLETIVDTSHDVDRFHSMKVVAIDLAAGSMGGVAGVLIGHPLDVVKVRMQAATSSMRSLSMGSLLMTTYRTEGMLGLWRGIGPPTMAVSLYQSTTFASYEWSLKQARDYGCTEGQAQIAGGLFSGAVSCLVTNPSDAVKIRLQLEYGASGGALADALRCGRHLVVQNGALSLFNGLLATMWRDVPSTVVYFGVYSKVKSFWMWALDAPKPDPDGGGKPVQAGWRSVTAEMMSGGCAGMCSWVSSIPADNVKTLCQEAATAGKPIGFIEAHRQVLARDGLAGFFRGAGPIILRSFPVNAITFSVYESLKRAWGVPCGL